MKVRLHNPRVRRCAVLRARRRGTVLIYSTLAMVVLMLVGSLAVDWGRVQVSKSELSTAVDAAGRAAVAYLPSDTAGARAAAIDIAGRHTVDGTPLVLQSGDIVFGKWNSTTRTLDTASASPDAVRIVARRTAARGTAINAVLARVGGINSFDLTLTSIVQGSSAGTYGIVGLNVCNIQNGSLTGTYNSAAGTTTTGASSTGGSVAGNSTFNLSSNVSIGGYVYYNTASAPSGTSYTAGKVKMSSAIATPATPAAGSYTSSNSNGSLGLPTSGANVNYSVSGTMTVPGGNYVLNSCSVSGGIVQFTGPATIWMYGNFSLSNCSFRAYQNIPSKLQIKFCSASGFNLSNSSVYGVVTAPTTPANINSNSRLYGSIFATQLSVDGSQIYYDSQLGTNGTSSSGSSLVQ